jgi:hypothetical protein
MTQSILLLRYRLLQLCHTELSIPLLKTKVHEPVCGPLVGFKCFCSLEVTLQGSREKLSTVENGNVEVACSKFGNQHDSNSQEILRSGSEHSDPRLRFRTSKHKDLKPRFENADCLDKDSEPPPKKNVNKEDTQQSQLDTIKQVGCNTGSDGDVEAMLASWRARLRQLKVAHSHTRNRSSSKQSSKLQRKPHHHAKKDKSSVFKCTNKHVDWKARLADSRLYYKVGKRVSYEAPVKDKQVHTEACAKKSKEEKTMPFKSIGAKKRDLMEKRMQKNVRDLDDTSNTNCIHEEIVMLRLETINDKMDTPITQESSGSVCITTPSTFDLDEIMNIDYLFRL